MNAKEQSLPVAVSTSRHETIEKLNSEPKGLSDIKFLLSDQSDVNFPIYICDDINTKLSHVKTVAVGEYFDCDLRHYAIYYLYT